MHAITRNKLLLVTYVLTILYALHYGIPLYVSSSYLHQYFNSSLVSMFYMIGSLGALWASISFSKYIKKYHTYQFTFALVVTEIIVTILFGITEYPYFIGLFFVIHFILQALLYICLNVFIESFSMHAETGSIRGLFLVLLNLGILISPLIGGSILSRGSFETLYIVSALTLVPFLFFMKKYFTHIEEPAYHSINMLQALKAAWRNKNLREILVSSLVLECFYAVMIIYSPIYLATLGVPLSVYLSFILPIAVAPLVVLPYELGLLADKKFGEKELLIGGLLILAVTTFLCVIITSPDARIWIFLLLISRIGAACVETMSFTYYFKKVGPQDAALTALFTNTKSLATVFVGATGIVIAPFLIERPQIMFIVLGCVLLWTVSYVMPLEDTR